MSFGVSVRQKRIADGIGLNEFADRLGVSPAYWSRVERNLDKPPSDEIVQRAAAVLGITLDALFVEAQRLPPDMRKDMGRVVLAYRRMRTFRPG